jgi:chain length determinant protein (polysaccharide antigen chain regulator)
MTQNNDNSVSGHSQGHEQIDLIDIFLQLWSGKWVIAAFVAVAIVITGAYLFVAKEKWTSTAVITMPDAGQISGYTSALSSMNGGSTNIADVQQSVIGRFSSAFSALSESLENQVEPEKLTIDVTVKGQNLPLKVTYQGDSAANVQKTLAKYIQKVDEQITDELYSDLTVNIKSKVTGLKESLATQENVAQEQKNLQIKQITQALKVAQESNIKSPQVQQTQGVTQDTLFLLGTEALTSMVKHEESRPLAFSDTYYQMLQNLLDIEKLKIDRVNIHAYRYVMKPDLPIRRDGPKRTLSLILGVLLGGMIGAGVVLGRNALRNYRKA